MKRTFTALAAVAVVAAGSAAASAAPVAPGLQWVIQSTPNRAVPSNSFQGVSCTSGKACTAVGSSGALLVWPTGSTSRPLATKARQFATKALTTTTLAERWDGAHWRIQSTPNPAGSSFSVLNAVSCSSSRACTAVGNALAGKATVPLAEHWNGSRWSIVRTPHPPKTKNSGLTGVSCPTSHECIAVGYYQISSSAYAGFAERWNGSRWALAGLIRQGVSTFLNAVSCSSVTLCTGVGEYQIKKSSTPPNSPLAERWAGGRWHKQVTSGTGFLFGVSCRTSSQCIAVGSQPNPMVGPNDSTILAMRWSGGKWRKQATPVLSGSTLGFLRGVSCPTVTSCTAAGWVELTSGVTVTANWNGTNWTLDLTPNPAGSLSTSFAGISCGVHIACRAVGSYEPPSFTLKTLVERG
jgi:hypothetical protein